MLAKDCVTPNCIIKIVYVKAYEFLQNELLNTVK